MDMFEFKARRPSGEIVSGKLNAANEAAVVSYIREQGMYATQIKKEVAKKKTTHLPFLKQKISLYDIAMFCRQFATLVGAGVSLVGALEIMIEQTTNLRFKDIIQKVGDDVRKGAQLSGALAGYPDVFPILMIHMIEAGEAGGVAGGAGTIGLGCAGGAGAPGPRTRRPRRTCPHQPAPRNPAPRLRQCRPPRARRNPRNRRPALRLRPA